MWVGIKQGLKTFDPETQKIIPLPEIIQTNQELCASKIVVIQQDVSGDMWFGNQLSMLSKIDALRGMTPWILVDFRSPRRQHPYYQDFWNRKGVLSETGEKKKAFFVLKYFYDKIELQYD